MTRSPDMELACGVDQAHGSLARSLFSRFRLVDRKLRYFLFSPSQAHQMDSLFEQALPTLILTALLSIFTFIVLSVYRNRVKIDRLRKAGYVRLFVHWSLYF